MRTSLVTACLLTLLAWTVPISAADSRFPVTTVGAVDLERYAGLWYEIARIPNRFQSKCASGVTAEYTIRDDGRLTVLNGCVREDGAREEAKGVARVVPASGNSKLQVSFFSIFGWRPVWGDYWILGLDADYGWVVVGTPDRKYGWVLARSPEMDNATLERVISIVESSGYEWSAFQRSAH